MNLTIAGVRQNHNRQVMQPETAVAAMTTRAHKLYLYACIYIYILRSMNLFVQIYSILFVHILKCIVYIHHRLYGSHLY